MQNPFQKNGPASAEAQDPLAFVKKLWGDMQLPGMVTPTLSLDDLDKQIQDLKTVESWLSLNMNMLRGSIQALEVQRATIAALKTMGESFTNTANESAAPASNASWPMHDQAKASNSSQASNASSATAFDPLLAENEEVEEDEPASSASATTDTEPPPVNPAAWWTVLQDQFKQALQTAMQDQGRETAPASSQATTPAKAKKATKATKATKAKTSSTAAKKTSKTTQAKPQAKTQAKAAAPRAKAKNGAKSKAA